MVISFSEWRYSFENVTKQLGEMTKEKRWMAYIKNRLIFNAAKKKYIVACENIY